MDLTEVVTGLAESKQADVAAAVEVFPNPTNDYITVRISTKQVSHLQFDLLDVSGTVIRTIYRQETPKGLLERSFDIGDLPKGMYFIKVTDDAGVVFKKIELGY